MLTEIQYNRENVKAYAKRWALDRNLRYLDFEKLGGDCTNFASQCIYAGCGVMNYKPVLGWYYNNSKDRTPSWSGVAFLYNFLIQNKSVGPYAVEINLSQLEVGDIIQLGSADGYFYHSPVVVKIEGEHIYIAAHTIDSYMRSLDSYSFDTVRYLHIAGARKYT